MQNIYEKLQNNVMQNLLLHFPEIEDNRGKLTFLENFDTLPFKVSRIFYINEVPKDKSRGNHAHKECHEILIALQGSFEVILNNGNIEEKFTLNKRNFGLHIPPKIWATELNFSEDCICLVLASHVYDESDYIRNYDVFLNSIH